jgi:Uma2 family endonuclease
MEKIKSPAEHKVILHNVSWETYARLLAESADSSAPRFTYDRGELEIMSPSPEHERVNRRLAQLVLALTEEMGVEVEDLGSTTFRREDLERGFEMDSCSYIENVGLIYGKDRVDLSVDPPPDLVIEVDIAIPSISKLPIYARMGVREVWRYDGERLTMWRLEGSRYTEIAESLALPTLTDAVASDFVERSKTMKRMAWLMAVREWARKHALPPN